MFKKLQHWHRNWEDEMLTVLRDPSAAATVPSGMRRCVASKLGELTPIERQQLHDFSARYRGRKFYYRLGVLALLLALLGSTLHYAIPNELGLLEAIFAIELMGLSLTLALVGIWFNYRKLTRFKPRRVLLTMLWTGALMLLGVGMSLYVQGRPVMATMIEKAPKVAEGVLMGAGGMLLLFGTVALYRNRQYDVLAIKLQHDAEQERLARQLSETQLRLLRSQIEPHFLFNTLGAVQQLAEQGAPRAAELTANLIDFLRASMEEMRVDQVSLAEEYALVAAYLKVMQVRLGSRLHFALQLPEELGSARLPGMMVLTLVENAIKHGIEPALRGGTVEVSAALVQGVLQVRVQDSGAGLSAAPVDGFGLKNIRDRLQLAYPRQSSLELRDAPDGGAIAELRLPLAQA